MSDFALPEPDGLRALWAEDRGALREIYVEKASIEEWQQLIDSVAERWTTHYSENGDEVLRPRAAEIFERTSDKAVLFEVQLNDIAVSGRFFSPGEIEFTFDPGDAIEDAAVEQVLDFMLWVGRSLGRVVHMTVESFPSDRPEDDLRYEPDLDRIVRPQHG